MKRIKLCIIVLPQFILLGYIIFVYGLYYSTLDDLLIADIMRGAFQGGSWDATYTSPLFSILMSILYNCWPDISWCGFTYVAIEFISMLLIDKLLYDRSSDIYSTLIYSLVSFICWYQMWWHFTYTTVAYAAVTAGALYIYTYTAERTISLPRLLPGIILFITGALIRREVLASVIIVLTPYLLWKLFREKNYYSLLLLFISITLYMGVGIINQSIKKTSETEWEYTKWDYVRQDVADHNSKEDILATGVWNDFETDCFYEQIEYDRDIYNIEKAGQVQKKLNNTSAPDKAKVAICNILAALDQYRHPKRYENTYFFLLLLLTMFAFIMDRAHTVNILMLDLGFFLTIVVFSYINRIQYRVAMPGGIIATIFVLYIISLEYKGALKYLPAIAILLETLLMVVHHIPYMADRSGQFDPQNKIAIEYLNEHSDKLFLAAQTDAFGLANCIPVLEVPSYNKANLIGNWNMYSESYYSIVSSYGISDPDHLVRSIPGNENIRLISKTEDGVPIYFIRFIEEYSGKTDVTVELEDTFDTVWMGEWGIYAIR